MARTLYLDTNVYRQISHCGEDSAVRRLLADASATVTASSSNLFETYAIADPALREEEVAILTRVASRFEEQPQSWYQAMEVWAAVRRHRPAWRRPVPRTSRARRLLSQHKKNWLAARRGELPDPASFARYSCDFETAAERRGESQKELRMERLGDAVARVVYDARSGSLRGAPLDLQDCETYWRAESLLEWSNALNAQDPGSRDYADWLGPYVKPRAFGSDDYPSFWLEDVTAAEVPKNRLSGLVSFYQLDTKITHGNAADAQHACHALDVAAFLTADRAFHDALTKSAQHLPTFAKVHLVDRAASSTLPSFSDALRQL